MDFKVECVPCQSGMDHELHDDNTAAHTSDPCACGFVGSNDLKGDIGVLETGAEVAASA